MDDPHLRQLKVEMSELELAFDTSDWENGYYLDIETGSVMMVQENTFRDLENIYSEYEYESDQDEEENQDTIDLAETLDGMDLEDWERQVLLQADLVKNGLDERFMRVPTVDSHEGFQDMEDFLNTVQNQATRIRLNQALRGGSPFRRFKDTLASYPVEREKWLEFKNQRTLQRIQDWLSSIGVKAAGCTHSV